RPPVALVGMHVTASIGPSPAPSGIIQEDVVPSPIEADSGPPAPGREESADAHAVAEANCAANEEPRPGRVEDDPRIIVGHDNKARIHGHDGNVRATAHHHFPVAPQVAIAFGDSALALYRVHHVLLLS